MNISTLEIKTTTCEFCLEEIDFEKVFEHKCDPCSDGCDRGCIYD